MEDLVADSISWAHSFHSFAKNPCSSRWGGSTNTKCISSAWGCQCTTGENAGCEHQSHIRMVMAHCSQHRCRGDDENIPLCTSANVLATATLPLIWIEVSQSEYGCLGDGGLWLAVNDSVMLLIGSMCSFVKASIRNIGEMGLWANEGNQNRNWERFHLL